MGPTIGAGGIQGPCWGRTFDLVVASHVLENVPNLIAFLNDMEISSQILVNCALYSLTIAFVPIGPDGRRMSTFCYTYRKPHRPTVADVYDYYALVHTGRLKMTEYHWHTAETKHNVADSYWHGFAFKMANRR